jgi:shikimate kinase
MVIFLTGFMGSGKNWWGEELARQAGIPFYDLDAEVEKSAGIDIVHIFRDKGEVFFREAEKMKLVELVQAIQAGETFGKKGDTPFSAVIATGGGTPCFLDNMEWMNQHGITVWLNPSLETLLTRLEKETEKRPLLQGKKGAELENLIQAKLNEREPFYKMAQIEIKNTHIAVAEFLNILKNASNIY